MPPCHCWYGAPAEVGFHGASLLSLPGNITLPSTVPNGDGSVGHGVPIMASVYMAHSSPPCGHAPLAQLPQPEGGFSCLYQPVTTPMPSPSLLCCCIFPHLPSPGNIGWRFHPGSLIYSGSA